MRPITKKILVPISAFIAVTLGFILIGITRINEPMTIEIPVEKIEIMEIDKSRPLKDIGAQKYDPTHEQEIWISALEWCESRGDKTAINPKDSDGTPSYYSFQFKPATFKSLLKRYQLPEADISDYETQREIVRRMIGDPTISFRQHFPNCVRLIGMPPDPLGQGEKPEAKNQTQNQEQTQ